jgi:hypothetical protein
MRVAQVVRSEPVTQPVSSILYPYDFEKNDWNSPDFDEYFQGVLLENGKYFLLASFQDKIARIFEAKINEGFEPELEPAKHPHIN